MRITWFSLVQKLNSMTTFCLLFMLSETFYFPKAIASQPPHSFQWGHCTSGSEEKDTGSSRKESFAVTQQHTVLANLWHASSYNWKTTLKCGHDRWKCHVKMSGKKIPIIFLYSIPCMGEKSITLYQENVFKLKKIYISISFFLYLENRSPENFSLCLRASIIIIGAQIVLFEQFKILCLLAFGISQVSIQSKSSVLLNRYCGTACTFCHYYTFQIILVYFFFCKSVQLPAARHAVWQWPTTVHTAGLLSLTAEVQVCLLLC